MARMQTLILAGAPFSENFVDAPMDEGQHVQCIHEVAGMLSKLTSLTSLEL